MHTELWVPSDSAKIVRYREGFGCVGGGAFMVLVGSAFLYIALHPDEALRSPPSVASVIGWTFTVLVFVPGVLMIFVGFVMVAKPERVHVDERGIWLRDNGKFELVAWTEISALQGRLPQPKVKDDPDSKPIPAGLLFQPADSGFLSRHPKLAAPEPSDFPRLKLPSERAVQRLTRAIADVRPDLLR
ncbi:hypothetical protein QFW96_07640 [Saccharopolyspora sp. TS4A08]|uniref:PH domain-containing protein n=1 Tax=Saccharopolyspora ipomoeae TaxID=3042027 RepID=A0ABT6PLB4_9PSEU|nr:hypothetical protein [Saccharopolyspora sp. TS4A08]MDI2028478.1 hypothetical protein [Saccharopolyspora sp. TS4A08]